MWSRTEDPRVALIALGVATGVAQALLLREAMAALGGSELAWGAVMSLWLAGMAVGSRLGVRMGSAAVGRVLPLVTLALAASGVVLLRAAPALAGAAPGETITTTSATWIWAAAVLPIALVGGLAFPILAGTLGPASGGRAYGLEAAGALLGGLALSLALAPLGTAAALQPNRPAANRPSHASGPRRASMRPAASKTTAMSTGGIIASRQPHGSSSTLLRLSQSSIPRNNSAFPGWKMQKLEKIVESVNASTRPAPARVAQS